MGVRLREAACQQTPMSLPASPSSEAALPTSTIGGISETRILLDGTCASAFSLQILPLIVIQPLSSDLNFQPLYPLFLLPFLGFMISC